MTEKKEEKKESWLKPMTLFVGAAGTVTASVAGSFFGDSGTLIGLAAGSVVSNGASAAYEHYLRRAHHWAKRQREPWRRHPVQKPPFAWHRWAITTGVLAASTAGITAGGIAVAEAASGKTVHGLVTNSKDYGTTFGTSSTVPPPPASPAPSPDPSPTLFSPSPSAAAPSSPSPSAPSSPSPAGSAVLSGSPVITPADLPATATPMPDQSP